MQEGSDEPEMPPTSLELDQKRSMRSLKRQSDMPISKRGDVGRILSGY